MPRLWVTTIEAHRREVRDAVLATTAALVREHGLRAVTMSQIAAETGIGRATLYKYFPDIDAILVAWHERQLATHFDRLIALRNAAPDPATALAAVLDAYALIQHEHDTGRLAAALHRGAHAANAQRRLQRLIRDLLAEAAAAGAIRRDVAPEELAIYCLHAVEAAGRLPSPAAVRRVVGVVLDGLRTSA